MTDEPVSVKMAGKASNHHSLAKILNSINRQESPDTYKLTGAGAEPVPPPAEFEAVKKAVHREGDSEKGRHNEILIKLQERVKELTALHRAATLLQDENLMMSDVMESFVNIIPPSWHYPEITVARITCGESMVLTPGFLVTEWGQKAEFALRDGMRGLIEVYYLKEMPQRDEGPFLKEERDLIDSLSRMLSSYFERKNSERELVEAKENLELQVMKRTKELERINEALSDEINERVIAEEKIKRYQSDLRQLGLQLSLAEERERRAIASDLHDHIGQALALMKMKLHKLQGNAIFCGYDQDIADIRELLDQTISYTRNLTFEISPPLLYELGLDAALEWLAEETGKKNGLLMEVHRNGSPGDITNEVQVVLFKAVRELLINTVKHGQAGKADIHILHEPQGITIIVQDDGQGFEPSLLDLNSCKHGGFGLFSIKERIECLGGSFSIASQNGQGTEVSLFLPALSGDGEVSDHGV